MSGPLMSGARLVRPAGPGGARAVAQRCALAFAVTSATLPAAACGGGADTPRHRERDPGRDAGCRDAGRPRAYFYPASDRTNYGPDVPSRDGCELLVADHLFCCPDAPRPTDR